MDLQAVAIEPRQGSTGQIAGALIAVIVCSACTSDSTFRGRFYWGHEVRAFQPCSSTNTYWVQAQESTMRPLRERSEELRAQRGKPYPPIYIEAVGALDTSSPRQGFARDYDGQFHLRKVERVSDVVPKDCG